MKSTLLLLALGLGFSHASEGNIAMHGTEKTTNSQIFYGKILEIKSTMGYKYLKVSEEGKELWVAIANAPVHVGDKIGYDKNTFIEAFTSKVLNQTFSKIYFASNVYLPENTKKAKSMKELLAQSNQIKKEKVAVPSKPFVKKEQYTVEEIHLWRDALKGQKISIKGTVFKVSHAIMKRDWIHLGDGSGKEQKLTDDLVFTATSSNLKKGDKVEATGIVVIDKDFGYGYFYKVIIENASFESL